jgi:large subunit ribosomal protein L7Ae
MTKKKTVTKTTTATTTKGAKGSKGVKTTNSFKGLFENTPRRFGLGQNVQPKRDLTRLVKWPKYIAIQRQKRILLKRLKVPGAINQILHQTTTANDSECLFSV